MYNDTIKAENKIISNENLSQIFGLMGSTLKKYKNISAMEEQRNHMLDRAYQNYTFKDSNSHMKVTVDFYDNTNIVFDNYETFSSVFYQRCHEIKSLDVNYCLYYNVITPEPNRSDNFYSQTINMHITENKMDIQLNLKSEDPKLEEIYNLIKNIILNAPEKYDFIIRNKTKINNTVGLSLGLIPAIVLSLILLFIPGLNTIFLKGFVVYPICALFLAFMIGGTIASMKLDKYYENIVPDKKSAGYDSNFKRIYKDDIDSFVGTSDILIGKKVDNLINRTKIQETYEKYKKFLPFELIVLAIISVIIIIVGMFI